MFRIEVDLGLEASDWVGINQVSRFWTHVEGLVSGSLALDIPNTRYMFTDQFWFSEFVPGLTKGQVVLDWFLQSGWRFRVIEADPNWVRVVASSDWECVAEGTEKCPYYINPEKEGMIYKYLLGKE